jgi:hypothetical protein
MRAAICILILLSVSTTYGQSTPDSSIVFIYPYHQATKIAEKENKLLIIKNPNTHISKKKTVKPRRIALEKDLADILNENYILALKPNYFTDYRKLYAANNYYPVNKNLRLERMKQFATKNGNLLIEDYNRNLHLILPNFLKQQYSGLKEDLLFILSDNNMIDDQYIKMATNPNAKEIYQLWRLLKNYKVYSRGTADFFFQNFKGSKMYKQAIEIYNYEGNGVSKIFSSIFKENFTAFEKTLGRDKADYYSRNISNNYKSYATIKRYQLNAKKSISGNKYILDRTNLDVLASLKIIREIEKSNFDFIPSKKRRDSLYQLCLTENELLHYIEYGDSKIPKSLQFAASKIMNHDLSNYELRAALFKNLVYLNRNKRGLEDIRKQLEKYPSVDSRIFDYDLLSVIHYKLGDISLSSKYEKLAEEEAVKNNLTYNSSLEVIKKYDTNEKLREFMSR